jgi:glycosyltransferase involved in cell wall biosynthesis
MKILILTSNYPSIESPSSGSFVKSQVDLLKEFGHDVFVGVVKNNVFGKKKIFQFIWSFFYPKKIQLNENQVYNIEIQSLNIFNKIIFNRIKKRSINFIRNYDIIHAHDPIWAGYFANYLKLKKNKDYIITSHIPNILSNNSNYDLLKYKIFENASLIFTVGNQDYRMFKAMFKSKKVINIGNYIDEKIYNPKNRINKDSVFTITTITSTSLRKDIPAFLKYVEILLNNSIFQETKININLIVAIVNDNYSLEELYVDIEKFNLRGKVNVLLNQPKNNVTEILKSTNLTISTSYYETFGLTLAESISMGIPVISVRNGESEDFIVEGVSGFVVNNEEYEIMVLITEKIMNKKIKIDFQKCHNSILKDYGSKAFINKLELGYKKLTND